VLGFMDIVASGNIVGIIAKEGYADLLVEGFIIG